MFIFILIKYLLNNLIFNYLGIELFATNFSFKQTSFSIFTKFYLETKKVRNNNVINITEMYINYAR